MRLVYLAMALLVAGVAMPAHGGSARQHRYLAGESEPGRPRSHLHRHRDDRQKGKHYLAYPDLNCTGKLTRIGGSGSYVFYAEAIVNNKFDATKKKGCLDGAVTLLRSGNALIYSWIGAYNDKPIVAYATLSLSATASSNPPASGKSAAKH